MNSYDIFVLSRGSCGLRPVSIARKTSRVTRGATYRQVCTASVAHMNGEFRYGVTLYDTTREYDVNLRTTAVVEGHARCSSTFLQVRS